MSNLPVDPARVEFGLDTFLTQNDNADGSPRAGDQVVRDAIEEAVVADELGVDVYNIGEHYRADMMDSAGVVVLAGIAARTKRMRLGTAVTVLSTQDPVRLFTQFSTLDAISNGRAEIAVGRASLVDSFALFGYSLDDYEALFEEKLDLFTRLVREQPVTWSGRFRSPLNSQVLNPPLPEGNLPIWGAVGGSPQSVLRAAKYDLPMLLAAIGGDPLRFQPYIELYYQALDQLGFSRHPVAMHSHGFVAATDEQARGIQIPHAVAAWAKDGRRGAPTVAHFENEIERGSQYIGSVDTVARKIARTVHHLGLSRFTLAYGTGTVPHTDRLRSVELYGAKVIPMVREMLADMAAEPVAVAR